MQRLVRLSQIRGGSLERRIEADAADCAALAKAFRLPAIASLAGDFQLELGRNGVVAAQLAMRAVVTQVCVVSLEEFEAVVAEEVALRFVPAASVRENEGPVLDEETLEGPDEIPYRGEAIDLGAVLAEQLALALDPYPRKPGAALPESST